VLVKIWRTKQFVVPLKTWRRKNKKNTWNEKIRKIGNSLFIKYCKHNNRDVLYSYNRVNLNLVESTRKGHDPSRYAKRGHACMCAQPKRVQTHERSEGVRPFKVAHTCMHERVCRGMACPLRVLSWDIQIYLIIWYFIAALLASLEKVTLNRTTPKFIIRDFSFNWMDPLHLSCTHANRAPITCADWTSLLIKIACFDMKQKKFLCYVSYANSKAMVSKQNKNKFFIRQNLFTLIKAVMIF